MASISPTYRQLLRRLKTEQFTWLVTGVAGFIGSHLLEALLRQNQFVVGLDNLETGCRATLLDVQSKVTAPQWRRFRFVEGDIRDRVCCDASLVDIHFVLHQAALRSIPYSIRHPDKTHHVNVTGFATILEASRQAGVSNFVYASSSSVYGDCERLPNIENQVGSPQSPYAASKQANEQLARHYASIHGMASTGLRYFNVFGSRQYPGSSTATIIPLWIDRLLKGQPAILHGDGRTTRDFCYTRILAT